MQNNIVYLDLNREFATIKDDVYNNKWSNEIGELKIPKGSTIEIQNALINLQGIEGGSIEIREDQALTLNYSPYLSHSDFLSQKYDFKDTTIFTSAIDPFLELTQGDLKGVYVDWFTSANIEKLYSASMSTIMNHNVDLFYDSGATDNVQKPFKDWLLNSGKNCGYMGGTEIPLFPVMVNANGYLEPVVKQAEVNIPKGVYGISQLSNFITHQLQNTAYQFGTANRFKSSAEKGTAEGIYTGNITSQLLDYARPWNYEYNVNASSYTTLGSIVEAFITHDINGLGTLTRGGNYLYILPQQFKILLNNYANGQTNVPEFEATTFFASGANFYASIKAPYPMMETYIPSNSHNGLYYTNRSTTISDNGNFGITAPNDYFAWHPIRQYPIGSANAEFQYNSTAAGFSFTYLHTSRQDPSHDCLGNKNTNAGENVSTYRQAGILETLIFFSSSVITAEQTQRIRSTMNVPRQRTTGVCVFNWDLNACLNDPKSNVVFKNTPGFNKYRSFESFYGDSRIELAKENWKKTFWYRLGFEYGQLNEYEEVACFDSINIALPGTTTNNDIDASIYPSIANQYCPSQSSTTTDFVNSGIPYALNEELKVYDLYTSAKTILAPGTDTYKSWKNIFYVLTQSYSVKTGSLEITANKLPVLSDEGYLIITSDIVPGLNDVLKNKSNIPLLGVVPKSNLSNQDFINSIQEITHVTTQDQVVNNIGIEVLNPDLTAPFLNENSTIILKITLNLQEEEQEEQQTKKGEKKENSKK